ncbi:MAG TPA: TetR family transcriptional regulator [Solirubrobacterales bacterium]|nr:TetR family transcriptional regulator [Solirubrobacterales bacterium]
MTPPSPSVPSGPRTQAQRRADTRAALLDATIESLVSYGYAGTTTGRIAELAGVSRGAQTPYFRNRAELVGAAVQHLAERRIQVAHERLSGRQVSIEEALDTIWEEHRGDVFDAALELWVASRTDAELRKNMLKVEREVATAIAVEAESALGDAARRPGFTDDLIFALATIRGLALLRISNGVSSKALAERWIQARERLARILS